MDPWVAQEPPFADVQGRKGLAALSWIRRFDPWGDYDGRGTDAARGEGPGNERGNRGCERATKHLRDSRKAPPR